MTQQQVKSIKFTEWNKGANPEMSPVTVHIHVNRNNLGFEVCKMCILMMCTFLYFSFFVCLLQSAFYYINHKYSNTNIICILQDVEDVDPAQTITLTTSNLSEIAEAIDLYYVKFQRVKSLTFFIEDNAGGDVTAIGGLKIMGKTVATTNMNDFKKQG